MENQPKYNALRQEYPEFSFDSFSYSVENDEFTMKFKFSAGDIHFEPCTRIPKRIFLNFNKLSTKEYDLLVFHAGMAELVSYWKCVCSPKVTIKPFKLTEEQISFWEKLYFNGLGEFFYRNGIETDFDSFMQINENSKLNPYKELFESGFKFMYLNPFHYVEVLGGLFEEGTRVGVYNKAIQKGESQKEAAFISRDSTIDFARGGSLAKNVNQFVPFFNANIQGVVSMTEKFKKHPVSMSLKAIAYLTLPSMALSYYYTKAAPDDDKKEYAEIPTWQKNVFWNVKLNGKWITIPKPFAYGAVFATLPQAMVEGITTDQDIDWVNQAKNIFDNILFVHSLHL